MEKIRQQVKNVLHYYNMLHCYNNESNINALQQQLYKLYLNFNKVGGGRYILNYPEKDELAECFTLMLKYDWVNDSDIREVWAENGFYCIIEYFTTKAITPLEQATAGLDLFIHLCEAKKSIRPKMQNILNQAVICQNPIFKDHYLNNNADYLINQFLYLSAKLVQPLLLINQDFLSKNYRNVYDNILSNEYIEKHSSPYYILEKARFVSAVIANILKDM